MTTDSSPGEYEPPYLDCTTARLEDQLVKELHSKKKYTEQAERLVYRINVFNPPPTFVISERDIPKELVKKLECLAPVTMNKVITNTVRRLYESIDSYYYHTSGISGKVKWGFDD